MPDAPDRIVCSLVLNGAQWLLWRFRSEKLSLSTDGCAIEKTLEGHHFKVKKEIIDQEALRQVRKD